MANRAGQQTQKQVKRRQKLEETFEEYAEPREEKMGGGYMRMADGGMATDATMDATSNRATNGDVCRGGGAALRGTKFRGVF